MGRPRKLTEEMLATVPQLLERGMSPQAIANSFDCTLWTLRRRCGERKIHLTQLSAEVDAVEPPVSIDLDIVVMSVPISRAAWVALHQRSIERRKSPGEFAAVIVETIVNDNLFDAVLDGA